MIKINVLLIAREELVCIVILLYLLFYSILHSGAKHSQDFVRICSFALCHVIFDLITVYTVNHVNTIAPMMNKLCHIAMYVFAIMFTSAFFCYVCKMAYSERVTNVIRIICAVEVIGYIAIMPFFKIYYLQGNDTVYSMGVAVIVGFAISFLYCILTLGIILLKYRSLNKVAVRTITPTAVVMMFAMLLQIVIPELLFTGASVTIVTISLFFALENPFETLKSKAFIDMPTGVYNKNRYIDDLKELEVKYKGEGAERISVGFAVCDLNGLKSVNDNFGHIVGDEFIKTAAQFVSESLKSASGIYRIGGDEFVAIYISPDDEKVKAEMSSLRRACETATGDYPVPVSIAVGYASTDEADTSLSAALQAADKNMYENKMIMKSKMKAKR